MRSQEMQKLGVVSRKKAVMRGDITCDLCDWLLNLRRGMGVFGKGN